MSSKSDEKTISELKREALATRELIQMEAKIAEELMRTTAKLQFSVDQIFRFFAPGIDSEEDKRALVEIVIVNPPEIYLSTLPLLPIAMMIANGRLPNAQRIYAGGNTKVEDSDVIFFAHVLRFCPQASQINYVDISRTSVTARGVFFMVEMVVERGRMFTLDARGLIPAFEDPDAFLVVGNKDAKKGARAADSSADPFLPRLASILKVAQSKPYSGIFV